MSVNIERVLRDDGSIDAELLQRTLDKMARAISDTSGVEFAGVGSPEGVVTASVGARYRRFDGGAGTSTYFKESGTNTNTGWTPK